MYTYAYIDMFPRPTTLFEYPFILNFDHFPKKTIGLALRNSSSLLTCSKSVAKKWIFFGKMLASEFQTGRSF